MPSMRIRMADRQRQTRKDHQRWFFHATNPQSDRGPGAVLSTARPKIDRIQTNQLRLSENGHVIRISNHRK